MKKLAVIISLSLAASSAFAVDEPAKVLNTADRPDINLLCPHTPDSIVTEVTCLLAIQPIRMSCRTITLGMGQTRESALKSLGFEEAVRRYSRKVDGGLTVFRESDNDPRMVYFASTDIAIGCAFYGHSEYVQKVLEGVKK